MYTIIDELGTVNRAIADLERIADKLKTQIKTKGIGTYAGAEYDAEVMAYDRENISAPLVRKFVGEDLVKQCTTIQHVQSVVVTLRKVA